MFLGYFFNVANGSPFSIFRIFRIGTKSFEAKTFGFFGIVSSHSFQLDRTAFYSQYFIELNALCTFFQSFSFFIKEPLVF